MADLGCNINNNKHKNLLYHCECKICGFKFHFMGRGKAATWQHHASVFQWAMCQNFEPGTSKLNAGMLPINGGVKRFCISVLAIANTEHVYFRYFSHKPSASSNSQWNGRSHCLTEPTQYHGAKGTAEIKHSGLQQSR